MGRKRATLTEHINAFKGEALLLLRYYIAWKRIIKFENIKEISRVQWADQMISLKCIENDLIIRTSKFDDTDSGVHSFQRAIFEMPNSKKDKAVITKKVKDFQKLIKKVKQKRRNEILAHLKIGSEDNFMPTFDLQPAIKLIVEIIDSMAGYKVGYAWSDGHYEKYDLRKELLGETTNDNLKLPPTRVLPIVGLDVGAIGSKLAILLRLGLEVSNVALVFIFNF